MCAKIQTYNVVHTDTLNAQFSKFSNDMSPMSPIVAVLVTMVYSLISFYFFNDCCAYMVAEDIKKKEKTIQKEIGFERNNTHK